MNKQTVRRRFLSRISVVAFASLVSIVVVAYVLLTRLNLPVLRCDCPHVRPLLTGNVATGNPAWSPHGDRIAFDRAQPSSHGVLPATSEIYVVNADDGEGLQRLTDDRVEDVHPTWAPDGRRIIFASDQKYLKSISLEDGKISVLFTCPYRCGYPAWSPDGKWLAFQMAVDEQPQTAREIWLLELETSQAHLLTGPGDLSKGLAWSPDSRTLLFTRRRPGTIDDSIVSLLIDGSGSDVLPLDGSVAFPAWYPSQDIIAFVRNDFEAVVRGMGWRVFTSESDGSNVVPLIDEVLEGNMSSPAISPDGQMLAFIYNHFGFRSELYLAELQRP